MAPSLINDESTYTLSQVDHLKENMESVADSVKHLLQEDENLQRSSIIDDISTAAVTSAMYYAIRSGDISTLESLFIFFKTDANLLAECLGAAYQDTQTCNLNISSDMKVCVEEKLLETRTLLGASILPSAEDIDRRREFLIDVIEDFTIDDYEEVDEGFLYHCRFIAESVHILKQQSRKDSHETVPWEEIEFVLVCFISAYADHQESGLYYKSMITKDDIVNKLKNFAETLRDMKAVKIESAAVEKTNKKGKKSNKKSAGKESVADEKTTSKMPVPNTREHRINSILNKYPKLADLYDGYAELRDLYSLERIQSYIAVALRADCSETRGQTTVKRALQVTGEHMKNTIQTPKMSDPLVELLLQSTPTDTRKILKDLRDSLSHVHNLGSEKERMTIPFFKSIQNDLKKIQVVIADVLVTRKINIVKKILKKYSESNNTRAVYDVVKALSVTETYNDGRTIKLVKNEEQFKIVEIVREIRHGVGKITAEEDRLLKDVEAALNNINGEINKKIEDLNTHFGSVHHLNDFCADAWRKYTINAVVNEELIMLSKAFFPELCRHSKPDLDSRRIVTYQVELVYKLFMFRDCVLQRVADRKIWGVLNRLMVKCLNTVKDHSNIDRINRLQQILNAAAKASKPKKPKKEPVRAEQNDAVLEPKLEELRHALREEERAVDRDAVPYLEILIMDILNVVDPPNNVNFLDQSSPILYGRCLRNYLAHGNALMDQLYPDTYANLILNSKILTTSASKNGAKSELNAGNSRRKYERGLCVIKAQKDLKAAIRSGNLKAIRKCVSGGAELNYKNFSSWGVAHDAASSASVGTVEYLKGNQIDLDMRDVDDLAPLHVAAASGSCETVRYLVRECGIDVEGKDRFGRTAMHLAATYGHTDTVRALLDLGAKYNGETECGNHPAHLAASGGHSETVEVILSQYDVDDSVANVSGQNPLHSAVKFGHLSLAEMLIDKFHLDANSATQSGATPLHLAAGSHIEIVKTLIKKGSFVNLQDTSGYTPLMRAIVLSNRDIVEILLENGAILKNKRHSLLHLAVEAGDVTIVESLLKYDVDVNESLSGRTALVAAAVLGTERTAELLIAAECHLDKRDEAGFTALHYGCAQRHNGIVKSLIKNKADLNLITEDESYSPLHLAAMNKNEKAILLLLAAEADVDPTCKRGRTPLHYYIETFDRIESLKKLFKCVGALDTSKIIASDEVKYANVEIVKQFIKRNANVNIKDKEGTTPLHIAVQSANNYDIVDLLLSRGANPNSMNINSQTALHIAVKCLDNAKIVDLLIENGANVSCADSNGSTPLHTAVDIPENQDVVKLLVDKVSDVDCVDAKGRTPLHTAAKRFGNVETVKILIKKAVDINKKDKELVTALMLAADTPGNHEIVQMLLEKDSKVNDQDIENISPLHLACRAFGNAETVRLLIRFGADVNIKDKEESRPLHLACKLGCLENVEALIAGKADVDACSLFDVRSISLAIGFNHKAIVEKLLEAGADVNAENHFKVSNLMTAMNEGDSDIVSLLVTKGAIVTAESLTHAIFVCNKKMLEALLKSTSVEGDCGDLVGFAAFHSDASIGRILIKKGFDKDCSFRGKTPLSLSVGYGRSNFVDLLLEEGAAIGEQDCLLHLAVFKGYFGIFTSLLNARVKTDTEDKNGMTALQMAVCYGRTVFVERLLKDSDVSKNAGLLHDAVKHKQLEIVKLLIQKGVDINEAYQLHMKQVILYCNLSIELKEELKDKILSIRAAHMAVNNSCCGSTILEYLLDNGAGVDSADDTGLNLLHFAAILGNTHAVDLLIKRGIDINIPDSDGYLPLHYTAEYEHVETAQLLLNNGAIHDGKDNSGATPEMKTNNERIKEILTNIQTLFESAESNDKTNVEKLTNEGSILNAKRCSDNCTVFNVASRYGYADICSILLKSGCDPNVKTKHGDTYLHDASKHSHANIVRMLLIHGAIYNAKNNESKTPLDVAKDDVASLLKLIQTNFKLAHDSDPNIVDTLNDIDDLDLFKAAMNARNEDGKTLAVVWSESSKRDVLYRLEHLHLQRVFDEATEYENTLKTLGKAYEILQESLIKSESILGQDDPITLDVLEKIVGNLIKRCKLGDAYAMLQNLHEKRCKVFGRNHVETIWTECSIRLIQDVEGAGKKVGETIGDIKKCLLLTSAPEGWIPEDHSRRIDMLIPIIRYNIISDFNSKDIEDAYKKAIVHFLFNRLDLSKRLLEELLDECLKRKRFNVTNLKLDLAVVSAFKDNLEDSAQLLNRLADVSTDLGKANLVWTYIFDREKAEDLKIVVYSQYVKYLIDRNINLNDVSLKSVVLDEFRTLPGLLMQNCQAEILAAAKKGDEIITFVEAGYDVNTCDNDGMTALHIAAKEGFLDIVKSLLKCGSDASLSARDGRTPLHMAVERNDTLMLRFMVEAIALRSKITLNSVMRAKTYYENETIFDIAERKVFQDVIDCLMEYKLKFMLKI